jgi:hypothetical protein
VSPLRNEQHRAEIGALNLAFQTAETAVALVGRVAQGLAAVDSCLAALSGAVSRALADPAGEALEQRAQEIAALLEQIDALARHTRFGEQPLLDGSLSASGKTTGAGLAFVSASPRVRSSPPEGYPVVVRSPPARARLLGERPFTPELLHAPMWFVVREGQRSAELRTRGGETGAQVSEALTRSLRANGLELRASQSAEGRLVIEHVRYGPGHLFWAESRPPGLLSQRDGTPGVARDGRDIAGTLNGEPAAGHGELLVGHAGNAFTDGLAVAFTGAVPAWLAALAERDREGPAAPPTEGIEVGRVTVVQRGLTFRFGPGEHQSVTLHVPSVRPVDSARQVENASDFACLAAIRVRSARQARDAARLVEQALREVLAARRDMERLLDERLLPHLERLRARAEILGAGPPVLADPALAGRLAEHVSARLCDNQELARLAQAQLPPGAVMKLIN